MAVIVAAISISTTGCAVMGGLRARKPAPSEFGLGPRLSSAGQYQVTLQPAEPLRTRKLQRVDVLITDAEGKAIDGATVAISGGMPQHGHGLPTNPRVTAGSGEGRYEIEGLRFNMGGWWELKLAINTARGSDVVTFNLSL